MTFPQYSIYHATKFAIEGLSESISYELKQHGIKIRIIEPGPIATDFYTRSMDFTVDKALKDNGAVFAAQSPTTVAKTIFKAANSKSGRLRYLADPLAWMILTLHIYTPAPIYRWITSRLMRR